MLYTVTYSASDLTVEVSLDATPTATEEDLIRASIITAHTHNVDLSSISGTTVSIVPPPAPTE